MKEWQNFILQILQEGREYLKLVLPAFLAWRIPAPSQKSKTPSKEEG